MATLRSSQPRRACQLSRSVSKAFRALGTSREIQCTRSLIQAYNDNDDEVAKDAALHQWLEAYVDEFSKHKAECVREEWIREYALLALIDVKNSSSAALVRRVYISLRACVKTNEYCSPVIIVALDNVLRIMDSKIVAKETQSLVSLGDDLLSMTDPKKCIFTRDTYETHMACLLTLERILIVLHSVECSRSKQRVVDFFQNKLRTHLKAIAADQSYYPFVYSTQLIKYNLDNLVKGDPTATLLNAGRRAFYAICGGLYLFQGIRELAVMRLDFAAMEAGVQKMQQAFSGLLDNMAPGLQEVVNAASNSEVTKDFSHILDCYMKHDRPSFMDGIASKKVKIVKFALVTHLTLFASGTSTNDLSVEAFCLLSALASNDDTSQWRADSDIYECLLDALATIGAKRQPLRQDCLQLLHQMENSSIQNQQTVKDWRGVYTLEQKLDMMCERESEAPNPSLYETVRKQLELHLTYKSTCEHKQTLIKHYQDESFAKVSLLLDDDKERHIADFDFHNVVYEPVDADNRVTNNVSSIDNDQMAHNLERTQWVQTPIKLQDIFAERRQKPSSPKEDVHRVLLLGNPGTGKTSLSKRLCHDWSTGTWGSEFDQVYLLQVRQLTGNRLQSEKTLKGAIATLLFDADCRSQEERNALHHHLNDELNEQTTLLMIDGLDEANGNELAEAIVAEAVSQSCSILILSRPHNLRGLPSKMDIQIECLGLSSDQVKAYVEREVPGSSDELLQFLKRSALVWEIAKIPINIQILCTIWSSEQRQHLLESKSVNLKSLYTSMTEYAWQRFEEKTKEIVDRQAVFSSLETIAFTAISQSKVEIPRDLVMKHTLGTTSRKLLLLDSGFLLFHKEGQVFQFVHLSFHEFFAGRLLAKSLRGSEREIKKAKKYIAEQKYCDTSRVTLSFMTQCYCQEDDDDEEEDCLESLKQLLSALDEDQVEVVGLQHIYLKMRTLDAFLSVCGSYVEGIRSDEELERQVQFALTTLDKLLSMLSYKHGGNRIREFYKTSYNQIIEELGPMPSLFAYLPEFLSTVLKGHEFWHLLDDTPRIARLVGYAPEQLLKMMPRGRIPPNIDEEDDGFFYDWFGWFKLFAESGPECAVLALEQLKHNCQSRNQYIRSEALRVVPYFLEVLPEREDLHSLSMKAMQDASADIRCSFLDSLEKVAFELNSIAANLAWTLTVEATKDDDKQVRASAFRSMVRIDVSSEWSIKKRFEVLQKFISGIVSYADSRVHRAVFEALRELLKRFPSKLTAFLPYLAGCCKCAAKGRTYEIITTTKELSSFLPTSQKRELGEMISKVFCDVEDVTVRKELVDALYNIGEKVPDFMTDFQDVFLKACSDTDENVRSLAEDREKTTLLTSVESVDAINEVFWDQSDGVKKELLRVIERESMINHETAEMVMEMAANCLESKDDKVKSAGLDGLLSSTRARYMNGHMLRLMLDCSERLGSYNMAQLMFPQQLDRLLEYFWDTSDRRVIPFVARKLEAASVSCKAVRSGKSIVSVMERGKKTEQEVPTWKAEKLIMLAKKELRERFGDLFS